MSLTSYRTAPPRVVFYCNVSIHLVPRKVNWFRCSGVQVFGYSGVQVFRTGEVKGKPVFVDPEHLNT
jgi:hypothetical protein